MFNPKIGEDYYYFKFCGVVRGDVWRGHPEQLKQVIRGRAPFKTIEEAKKACEKLKLK